MHESQAIRDCYVARYLSAFEAATENLIAGIVLPALLELASAIQHSLILPGSLIRNELVIA